MPGLQVFTKTALGKETNAGTPVNPTRNWPGLAVGVIDPTWEKDFAENETTGWRTKVRRATVTREVVALRLEDVDGIGFDDLVLPLLMSENGAATASGASANKTWVFTPGNTAISGLVTASADVGDDVQNWRAQYVGITSWTQSAESAGLTKFTAEAFAQRAVKTARAAVTPVTSVKIPGELWTMGTAATFAGLSSPSALTNSVISHSLTFTTGFAPKFRQAGALYFAYAGETGPIGGTLECVLEASSTAVALYDFTTADSTAPNTYIRLKATSPIVLGTGFYSLQHDIAVIWDKVEIISAEEDGTNLYRAVGRLTYDSSSGKTIESTLVCSLAAAP